MTKKYLVTKGFRIGEIDKEVKKDQEVEYDIETGKLVLKGITYTVTNLKSAINVKWLQPVDGNYPELDGPIGETMTEAAERRRKERFTNMANPSIKKDINIKSMVHDHEPEFLDLLNAEPLPGQGFNKELVADDAKEVAEVNLSYDKELAAIKKVINKDGVIKGEVKEYKVFKDHYDADMITVGKIESTKEVTLKNWSSLHWSKKVDIINKADRTFLNVLKSHEKSPKLIKRIEEQINKVSNNGISV